MVSDRDRSHLERIGEFKAASHAAALQEHRQRSISERLALSWQLFEAYRDSAPDAESEEGPAAFYARARQLGLYRP